MSITDLDVPIFPDEFYTVRNSLKHVEDNSYCIDWKLLRSVLTKDSVGSIRVEPWEGGAVICYQNLVTPASNIAVLLRGKAIEQMKETTQALATQVEKGKIIGLFRAKTPGSRTSRGAPRTARSSSYQKLRLAKRRGKPSPKGFSSEKRPREKLPRGLGAFFSRVAHPSSKLLCLKRSI